jgi:hypothetical protein
VQAQHKTDSWRKIAIAIKTGDQLATGWFVGYSEVIIEQSVG